MIARLRHWWLAAAALPLLVASAHWRRRLAEMRAFCRRLPAEFRKPLPEALQSITPDAPNQAGAPDAAQLLAMADLAALLDRRSPLGLCLRRSATRFHYLRGIGVPVVLHFGARLLKGKPDREVTGHAWLTLDGRPYHESDENWRGFTVMISYPL